MHHVPVMHERAVGHAVHAFGGVHAGHVVHHVRAVFRLPAELHRIEHAEDHGGVREDQIRNDGCDGRTSLPDARLVVGDEARFQKTDVEERKAGSHVGDGCRDVNPGAPFGHLGEVEGGVGGKECDARSARKGRELVEGNERTAFAGLEKQKDFAHDVAFGQEHRNGHEKDEQVPRAHHELHIVRHSHFESPRN